MVDFSNTMLVTHRACWDGSAAAVLFMNVGGRKENIIFSNPDHASVDEIVKDLYYRWSGEILIVDLSVSEDLAELLKTRNNVLLFDHHKSAEPLCKHKFCTIDMHNCGSKLFYNWLLSLGFDSVILKYKEFVDNVDDIDRWQHNISSSKEVGSLHGILGSNLFIERFMKNASVGLTNEEFYVMNLDNAKYKDFLQDKKSAVMVRTKKIDDIDYRIGFVFAGGAYRSRLGNDLCNDSELNIDAVIMVSNDFISMRSRGSVDVSKLAKKYGGGGHVSASGCSVAAIIGKNILEEVANNLKLE